jgi:nitroreductase
MDILDAIERRTSVRDYLPAAADPAALEAVRLSGDGAEPLTATPMRFLREESRIGSQVKGVFGDYGKLIRAPHFVVLAALESAGYLVDAGYRFEQMVLEATRRGLGTCWVGGLFREASLRDSLGLEEAWRVITLSPIGLPGPPRLVSRALRAAVGSASRRPLAAMFFRDRHGAPLTAGDLADSALVRVLEAARRAPSWANRQPWLFILSGPDILVYKTARQIKEGKDYHLLDCGIAMAHLHLAATALGMGGRWDLAPFEIPGAPDAEPVARYRR